MADPEAVVAGDRYRITVLTDGLLRLEYSTDGIFEDRASTFATHRALPPADFSLTDGGGFLEITTSRFRLVYDKRPFSPHGLSVAVRGPIDAVWRYGQAQPDNLGGTARTLDAADGPVPLEPGVLGRRGIAAIDDSGSFLFDDGWIAPREPGRTDIYVFAYGRDHAAAMQAFYAVSGPVPVLPRYALGNWWSRFHPYTSAEYQELVDRFAEERVPVSVGVMDMDWHLTDIAPEHGVGWTGYTWNRDLVPDPRALLTWLHERGIRVTLNLHPAEGVRAFEEAYPAMARALGREADGTPIAFDVTDREFVRAYLSVLHRDLEAQGVDFWWIDWQQGEHSRLPGVDPLWVLNHAHHGDSARDGRRGLILSRYAGPGSHRYPVGFSGDAVISWASLAFQPYFTATAANIGFGWWSHDIGGHFGGVKDDELTVRWVQLGVFSPILRLHSGRNPFLTKEPWSFAEPARSLIGDLLRLRHRLLPYLHTMNHRAASGTPLVQPMYHRYPDAAEAYERSGQYLFGSQLLVAPITSPADAITGTGQVRVWLPETRWVDLFTDLVYDGGREVLMHRDLSTMPVLAPAGAIVPLDGALSPGNDVRNPDHLEVVVVVEADGEFELVEDDGRSGGAAARTRIAFAQEDGTVVVGASSGAVTVLPERRTWTMAFPGLSPQTSVTASVDGQQVDVHRADTGTRVRVTVPDVPRGAEVRVRVGASPRLQGALPVDVLFERLDRAALGHDLKKRAFDLLTSGRPLGVRLAGLQALGLRDEALENLTEVLLARA